MTSYTLPRAVVEQALDALNSIDVGYRSPNGNPLEVSFDEEKCEAAITALRAALAQQAEQAEPVTIERLRDALVASRIIPPAAVEDPDEYDDGVTLYRIEALHRRIT